MKHGSLFSGIGGFDLASEWMGWENIFHCEWNEFGTKVLNHYWPQAISYHDITKTDFSIHRGNIDILTGGFPCQPYSLAGKRLGKEDERHLWPEMLRAIREIQPTWVVGENVLGLVGWNGGMVFDEVQADLEAEGYQVQPFILPAASVNAPHKRDRVWFVAHSNNKRSGSGFGQIQSKDGEISERNNDAEFSNSGFGTYTNTKGKQSKRVRIKQREISEPKQGEFRGNRCEMDNKRNTANTNYNGLEGCENRRSIREVGAESHKQSARCIQPDWENFPTQSPICNGDDGLSSRLDGITFPKWRNESIKAGGNAIVPQVVYQIYKSILEYEKRNSKRIS